MQTPLDNLHFSYKIDVSRVGCHCNSAAYFINMPGNNPGAGGDYYCDANFGNSIWCPEYDTWEGNKYTMAGTDTELRDLLKILRRIGKPITLISKFQSPFPY